MRREIWRNTLRYCALLGRELHFSRASSLTRGYNALAVKKTNLFLRL
jgi:hypothetical protein